MNNVRDNEILKSFGARLKALRNERSLTLEKLAYAADIEISQVHRIEIGKINPTITTLAVLAAGLNISISELTKDI